MNGMTKWTRILILLAVLMLPLSTVHAQGPGGDVVLFGQDYKLESGEELSGSLAVIGGNILLEENSNVGGDIVLIGGNLKVLGSAGGDVIVVGGNLTLSDTVDGDIVIVGGQAELTATAEVNGDVVTIGGQLRRDPQAQVRGDIINNFPMINIPDRRDVPASPDLPDLPAPPDIPDLPDLPVPPAPPEVTFTTNPLWGTMNVVARALVVAAIGMLLSLFFQMQFERVGDAIVKQPFVAGGFGLLVVIVTPLALVVLVITILLIPVAIIVGLMIPLTWLFGVVALGQEVGDRFTRAINQSWAPVLSTGLGTFLLMLLGGFFGMVPCIGWLVPFLVALVSMGGVVMTWFGTRSAPGSNPPPVEVPPVS